MNNVLIAYFSASGTTRNIAEKIANENNYDMFEIKPVEAYTKEDLDWTNEKSRTTIEMNDKKSRPQIKESYDISEYDTIIIGFPVWWYTAPHIINTFIESVDLTEKTIKLFCTSGGSGIDKCVNDLSKTYPKLKFSKGIRIIGDDISNIKSWVENE